MRMNVARHTTHKTYQFPRVRNRYLYWLCRIKLINVETDRRMYIWMYVRTDGYMYKICKATGKYITLLW